MVRKRSLVPLAVVGLLIAAPVSTAAPDGAPRLSPAGGGPGGPAADARGAIEGVVRMRPIPQRRAAARYPNGGGAARPIQDIPALVYIRGRVDGARPTPGEHVMNQRDQKFEPSLLVVPVGAVVRFPNLDPTFHNVFSYSSPARFDLGRYPRGESKDVRFEEVGIVRVYCEVHESMRAAIVVVENPYWAVLDDDGRFRIADVPPGTYTLVAWHTDRREREVEIRVSSGGTARVDMEL